MDVPSGGLETSPGAWKFLMEMFLKKFHGGRMDVLSGGLEPGDLPWSFKVHDGESEIFF
jgi:hypothetical protein